MTSSWQRYTAGVVILSALLVGCATESNTSLDLENSGLITPSTSSLDGAVGVPYADGLGVKFTVAKSASGATYYWTVTGLVPPGLIVVPASNTTLADSVLLAGTPLTAGTFTIKIAVHKPDHTLLIPEVSFPITIGGTSGSPPPGGTPGLSLTDLAGTWTGLIASGPEATKRLSFLIDTAGVSRQATVASAVIATSGAPLTFAVSSAAADTNIAQLSWHLVCGPTPSGDLDCTGHHFSGDTAQNGTVLLAKVSPATQDFQAPSVSSSVPANNATVSSIPADVRVTFSELMASAPVSSITLAGGGLPRVNSTSFGTADEVDRRTLRAQISGLLAGATYTITLNPSGQSGIIDLAGNPLLPTTITFSTATSTVNQPPSATPDSYTVVQGLTRSIVLRGTDPEGGSLTYQVTSQPTRGSLTGSAPNVTYTAPATTGADSFAFTVTDPAGSTSPPATISIAVVAANQAPIAFPDSIGARQGTPTQIPLYAIDPERGTLSYTVVTGPTNGTLEGTGNVRTYTSNPGYLGPDQFTFTATDNAGDTSAAVTVAINVVSANNQPPTATPQTFTFAKRQQNTILPNARYAITLTGSDPDGDPLTFRIARFPSFQDLAHSMSLVAGQSYRFVDPGTAVVSATTPATTSSTVNGPVNPDPGKPFGDMSVNPLGSPFIAVYTPLICHTFIGRDTLEFVAIDSNGLRSAPATITMNESTSSCTHF